MARTITLYGADTDTVYTRYKAINKTHVQAISEVETIQVRIIDAERTVELNGDNIEYLDGELSNNTSGRRQFAITCEPFTYSSNSYGGMNTLHLSDLQRVLRKKYLWVTFYDYEFKSGIVIFSDSSSWVIPVVVTDTKSGKDNEKGVRTFDFTLTHRWNNDLQLTIRE